MFNINDRVKVVEGCEDGGDDRLVGKLGTVKGEDEGYYEVLIDDDSPGTYLLGEYQIETV